MNTFAWVNSYGVVEELLDLCFKTRVGQTFNSRVTIGDICSDQEAQAMLYGAWQKTVAASASEIKLKPPE